MRINPVLVLAIALPLLAVAAGVATIFIAANTANEPMDAQVDRWARPLPAASP